MFRSVDVIDALFLLILAVLARPVLLREDGWGVPVIDVHDLKLLSRERIGVLVHGRQAGLLPRLLAFAGIALGSTLEVDEELVALTTTGILGRREKTIRLADVKSAEFRESAPAAPMAVFAVIGIMVIFDRLPGEQANVGVWVSFISVFMWIVCRSVELVVTATDGTRMAVTFSTVGAGPMLPFDALQITELIQSRAMRARRESVA